LLISRVLFSLNCNFCRLVLFSELQFGLHDSQLNRLASDARVSSTSRCLPTHTHTPGGGGGTYVRWRPTRRYVKRICVWESILREISILIVRAASCRVWSDQSPSITITLPTVTRAHHVCDAVRRRCLMSPVAFVPVTSTLSARADRGAKMRLCGSFLRTAIWMSSFVM
jgi:hypothetical protein